MDDDVAPVLGGRYRIAERLGRGGMADVYRAEDLVLRRSVAIKIFRGGLERDNHLARFRAEVRTLAGLTHPHLVTLYDAGGGAAEPWCVMEYVDGGSLGDHEGALDPAWVARIGQQVADALAYVHGEGIVHRDVKPSNVLLDRSGGAFLSDFGVVRLMDGTRMTQSGLMIGTAAFLSPEQVRGEAATAASDVYALGLVLLEALTGRREYPGTPVESAVARLSRPPVVPAALGAAWVRVLTEMTATDPALRAGIEQAQAQLGEIVRRSPQPTSAQPASTQPDSARVDLPRADLPAPDSLRTSSQDGPPLGRPAGTRRGPRNVLGWLPERARPAALALAAASVAVVVVAVPFVGDRLSFSSRPDRVYIGGGVVDPTATTVSASGGSGSKTPRVAPATTSTAAGTSAELGPDPLAVPVGSRTTASTARGASTIRTSTTTKTSSTSKTSTSSSTTSSPPTSTTSSSSSTSTTSSSSTSTSTSNTSSGSVSGTKSGSVSGSGSSSASGSGTASSTT